MTTPSAPISWEVIRLGDTAERIHLRDPEPDPGHQLWLITVPTPALVLGSTQPDGLVEQARARADGIEVCRRRSGGGLVSLDPRTDCWIDVVIPPDSPLWRDDIGTAFHWLGQRWAQTLDQSIGAAGPSVVHRPMARSSGPSRRRRRPMWCFADLGHGEVSIGGRKIVGLSQRRTRHWARLQSLVLGAWPGRRLRPYIDRDVAATLAGDAGLAPGQAAPHHDHHDHHDRETDPAGIRAGPPPGLRLPEPAELTEAFVDHVVHHRPEHR